MSGSVNKVMLVGRLGADPEIRRTQDGRPIANLRVCTEESWRDKVTGERKVKTEWHRVVIFSENLCKIVEQYFKKGTLAFFEGSLQTRKWIDQGGQDRYSTEVVLQNFNGTATILSNPPGARDDQGDRGEEDQGFGSRPATGGKPAAAKPATSGSGGARRTDDNSDMNDEIPFDFIDLDRFKP